MNLLKNRARGYPWQYPHWRLRRYSTMWRYTALPNRNHKQTKERRAYLPAIFGRASGDYGVFRDQMSAENAKTSPAGADTSNFQHVHGSWIDARTGHHHGTKFRMRQDVLPMLYAKQTIIL